MACRVGDTSGQFNFQFNLAVSYKYFQLPVQVVSTNLLNTSGDNESCLVKALLLSLMLLSGWTEL